MNEGAAPRPSDEAALASSPAPAVAAVVPHVLQTALSPGEIVILVLRPSAMYPLLSSLGTLVVAALLTATLAYAAQFSWSSWTDSQAFLAGGLLAVVRLAWACVEWQSHSYLLTDRRVLTRRGVFRVVLHETPLSRIQNTIVVQSLRERVCWLGTLGFATAGRGTFDAYWETVRAPFKVHRTVLETIERYGRRDANGL